MSERMLQYQRYFPICYSIAVLELILLSLFGLIVQVSVCFCNVHVMRLLSIVFSFVYGYDRFIDQT